MPGQEKVDVKSFEEEVSSFSSEKKCVQRGRGVLANSAEGDCFFGVPPSKSHHRDAFVDLPDDARGFHFYLGADGSRMVDAFAKSRWAERARYISIGNTSHYLFDGVDYREAIRSLGAGSYPDLEVAELGVWRLFSNSHCMMGQLGCLNDFLAAAPSLEVLRLFGSFQLKKRFSLPRLRKLCVQQEDPVTGSSGEAIANSTVVNILDSDLPSLEDAYIDLERDGDQIFYEFPDRFVEGKSFSSLSKLTVYGSFLEGEYSRLKCGKMGDLLVDRLYPDSGF